MPVADLAVREESRRPGRPARGCEISAARNSRKPSSSSASRRIAGASVGRVGLARPRRVRTASWSRSRRSARRGRARARRRPPSKRRVEELDVVPDAAFDPAARVDELEREVRRAAASSRSRSLARDRVDALDDAVLGELGDRRPTSVSLVGSGAWPTSAVPRRPLRRGRPRPRSRRSSVRRDRGRASAPRYFASEPAQRRPPDLPDRRRSAGARSAGVARRRRARAGRRARLWWLEQDFVGPDGVARVRARPRRLAARRAVRDWQRPAARADAPRARGGAAAAAARDARAARADLPALRGRARALGGPPERPADLEAAATGSGALEGVEAAGHARRRAAPDRRRAPPLRDARSSSHAEDGADAGCWRCSSRRTTRG